MSGEDTGYAAPRWTFDQEVTRVFDDMLERSIPQYAVMRDLVSAFTARFVRAPGDVVVDLGAARGGAIAALVERRVHARFVAVETSQPMLDALRLRLAPLVESGQLDVQGVDLREGYPVLGEPAAVTLAVLTLQFVPIEYRQRVIADAYRTTRTGGAFVVVEKVLGATSAVDALMVDHYTTLKCGNGYTPEDVARKRLSLEGRLVPMTAAWNVDALTAEGFRDVDCFWRWANFAAWLAIRP